MITPLKDFDSLKLEQSCEELIGKLLEKSSNLLLHEVEIYYFLSENLSLCESYLRYSNYKTVYFILKKHEKLLALIFNKLQTFDSIKFPLKQIYSEFIDRNKEISSIDISLIINQKIENPMKELILHENKNITFFFEKMMRFSVFTINNLGVLLLLKDKNLEGFQTLARILFMRLNTINSLLAMFHIAVIELNIGSSLFKMEKIDFANIFVNRALKNLEFLGKIGKNNNNFNDFIEKNTDFLCVLEIYNEKKESKGINSNERINKLLELGYLFYSSILERLNKKTDSETIKNKSKHIGKEKKSEEEEKKSVIVEKKEKIPNKNDKFEKKTTSNKKNNQSNHIHDDNFSSASFKTVQTNLTIENDLISKENIIYQKYIEVNKNKYKIIMIQISEHNCVEILLYCKPRQFLKKIFIGFENILNFAKTLEGNVLADEKSLKTLFKSLAKKLYVRDDELYIKDLEFYHSLEDYIKSK